MEQFRSNENISLKIPAVHFPQIIMSALAYALLGVAGLSLSGPPGYASPVFPAAGLAIALVLYYGNRILPGVLLGSFSINMFVAWQHGKVDVTSVMVAVIMACGATLQTWAARKMVVRWQGNKWRTLEMEKEIVLFLAIAAPLSCLIAATTGAATLYCAGFVSLSELLYTWWNWWVGVTFGVLIFTPLTLIFLLRAESPWKERKLSVAAPMLLTLCLVAFVFMGVARRENEQLQNRLMEYGNKLAQSIDRRLVAHQEAISSLRRLMEIAPDMTYSQFEYFTRITLNDNSDIFAMSYNPYVQDLNRKSFERSMAKKSITKSFIITERNAKKELVPAAVRPYYVTVGYIAPLKGNLSAIGFDINSDALRRSAIDRARATGHPAVTVPIQLVQEKRKRVGVLVLHPAYQNEQKKSGAGTPVLIGFSVGVLKVYEMVQIATKTETQKDMVFHLTDSEADAGHRVIYQSDGGHTKPLAPYIWKTTLAIADRQWTLTVMPTDEYLLQHNSMLTWGVGVAGLLFSALLQVMMLGMTGRTAVIQRRVAEQTIELTHAKEELELLNKSLLQRVEETIAELRQKDQVLITQGRQAAMGEMIGNIAHQWRQPLNTLAMVIGNLQFAYHDNELTDEYMEKAAATATRMIQKMSSTINDFRNFFSPEKKMEPFSALQKIRLTVELVEAAFRSSNIVIYVEGGNDCTLYGYPNEYSHVLLNLLANAKDAIVDSGSTSGRVTIKLREDGGMGVVSLLDNGGGIAVDILDKIFEPYFSTKNMGTGIGLYMSKMIIERSMKGYIEARSVEGGSEFSIHTPLSGGKSVNENNLLRPCRHTLPRLTAWQGINNHR